MSRVLFLANVVLADAKRGTPLHICTMLREIRREHTLLVCAHSVPADLADVFIAYPLGRGLGKLLALRSIVKRYRITHVLTAGEIGLLAPVLLKLICRVKIVEELHGMGFEEQYADGSLTSFGYVVQKWYVWFLLHFYDLVIVMLRKQIAYYAPMSKHWLVAYVAVNVDEVPNAAEQARDPSSCVLGYMGNAREYQGLPFLIEAAAVLKKRGVPVRLNLILSGEIGAIEAQLTRLGLRSVAMIHRNVPHEEAFRLIAASDVLVIPRPSIAITEYAFPSKLPEYLATGLPVILTDVGPVDELRDALKQYCFIIPPTDIAQGIADAVQIVGTIDPKELQQRGARARKYAHSNFSWSERGRLINQNLR